MTPLDFGRRTWTLRTGLFSCRVEARVVVCATLLLLVAVAAAFAAVFLGDYPLTVGEVARALTGRADDFTAMVVLEWRMPIVVAAVAFGAMLGVGGAIFQSLTRNPLGSPDIIGFDAGSYTAVVVTMLVLGVRDYWTIAAVAIGGGLVTAIVVYLLARRGGVQGFRLIVVGIAVSAMLGSVNSYLITRADVREAMVVGFWSAGSISRVSWSSLVPSLVVMALIVAACTALAPQLRTLELGDDTAATQGVRVGGVRLGLMVVGVATTALVTAAAGPIGFISLVAPQLARRLTGTAGVNLVASAAMGAALLAAAQLVSLVLAHANRPVPVGLVTVCVGGLYLIGLLIRESRRQAGVVR
ncbi:FecCD family ABC transporter permease [Propioniciclava soli]|uniref:FecCD family ABC transporter permease n=1 Tax=Propioniciclava soli TaxID=2775081 RepID=UPI001E5F331F